MKRKTLQQLGTQKLVRRPSQPAIDEEVIRLTGLIKPKARIPQFDAFGENHWKAVRAQINVLEKRMTEDEIYDTYGVAYDSYGTISDTDYLYESALEAHKWMTGQTPEPPYPGWQCLVGKPQVKLIPPPQQLNPTRFDGPRNFGYDPSTAKLEL